MGSNGARPNEEAAKVSIVVFRAAGTPHFAAYNIMAGRVSRAIEWKLQRPVT